MGTCFQNGEEEDDEKSNDDEKKKNDEGPSCVHKDGAIHFDDVFKVEVNNIDPWHNKLPHQRIHIKESQQSADNFMKYGHLNIPQWVKQLSIDDHIDYYLKQFDEWIHAIIIHIHHTTNELTLNYELTCYGYYHYVMKDIVHCASKYIAPFNSQFVDYTVISNNCNNKTYNNGIYHHSKLTQKEYIISTHSYLQSYQFHIDTWNIIKVPWNVITQKPRRYVCVFDIDQDTDDIYCCDNNSLWISNLNDNKDPILLETGLRDKLDFEIKSLKWIGSPINALHIFGLKLAQNKWGRQAFCVPGHWKYNILQGKFESIDSFSALLQRSFWFQTIVYVPFKQEFMLIDKDNAPHSILWFTVDGDNTQYYQKYEIKQKIDHKFTNGELICFVVFECIVIVVSNNLGYAQTGSELLMSNVIDFDIDGKDVHKIIGRYRAIWCLNLLTNECIKATLQIPLLNGGNSLVMKSNDNYLHFYPYGGETYHYKVSLYDLMPGRFVNCLDKLLNGYSTENINEDSANLVIPNDIFKLIKTFWCGIV